MATAAPSADTDIVVGGKSVAAHFDRIEAYCRRAAGSQSLKQIVQFGRHDGFAAEAAKRGYSVALDEPLVGAPDKQHADLCIVLEGAPNLLDALVRAWDRLRPGGALFAVLPSSGHDSASRDRSGFDRAGAESLLFRGGFEHIRIATHEGARPYVAGLARKGARGPLDRRTPVLSVVMPVFNERATFSEVTTQLLARKFHDLDLELIIVESKSTDGTRDEVRRFEGDPRVKVVYEDQPRGKGHAVREGFASATGDFILIQDADLEYDLDDYERLLEPLRSCQQALVLGSRYRADGSSWKLRRFTDQIFIGRVMNLAHVSLTWLFNVVYGTRLRDPFTMYKVFRRDCLSGLTFESNRFDFDWELLAKLVRSGYAPIEIPVKYASRSYQEGKKVRFWRDPLTWLFACFKYRLVSVDKR